MKNSICKEYYGFISHYAVFLFDASIIIFYQKRPIMWIYWKEYIHIKMLNTHTHKEYEKDALNSEKFIDFLLIS